MCVCITHPYSHNDGLGVFFSCLNGILGEGLVLSHCVENVDRRNWVSILFVCKIYPSRFLILLRRMFVRWAALELSLFNGIVDILATSRNPQRRLHESETRWEQLEQFRRSTLCRIEKGQRWLVCLVSASCRISQNLFVWEQETHLLHWI